MCQEGLEGRYRPRQCFTAGRDVRRLVSSSELDCQVQASGLDRPSVAGIERHEAASNRTVGMDTASGAS